MDDDEDDIEIDDLNDVSEEKARNATMGTRQRPRRRGLPQRSKSDHGGALMRAASLRKVNRVVPRAKTSNTGKQQDPTKLNPLGSKSDHSTDSFFDFDNEFEDEAPLHDWTVPSRPLAGNSRHSLMSSQSHSRHSTASHTSDEGDMSGDSFHGEEDSTQVTSRSTRNRRGGLQRTPSLRRKVTERRRDVQRGVARHHSSDRSERERPVGRRPPTRTRSDALTSARREQMKAQYRSQADGLGAHSNSGGGAAGGAAGNRRAAMGLSSTQPRRTSMRDLGASFGELQVSSSHDSTYVGSSHDSMSGSSDAIPKGSESGGLRRMERAKSGLEMGALGAKLNRPPARTRSDDSLSGPPSVSSGEERTPTASERKWLERRANKQTEILSIAHDVRDRFEEDRERHEIEEQLASKHGPQSGLREAGVGANGDDDQPMAMRTKKSALEQIKSVVNKTGAGARSFGKGTVNAISDPKLAAKRFGHLSKDVGKATIKTALDPKKMAKGAKSVTVGSAKMGAGLTKGVAKSTFGATKTVVKGGVSAASGGAKLTMKGTKKVVKGTVRVVKGKDKNKGKGENEAYDARELSERNQSNFYDRIAQMVETSDSSAEDKEKAAAEAAALAAMSMNAQTEKGSKKKKSKHGAKVGSSVLMPTDLITNGGGSWDV